MLARLIRGLVGDKPVEFGRRVASAFAGPAPTPLAQRVLDYYRDTPPPPGAAFQEDARIFTEELLRETDPVELVASLVISLPAIIGAKYPDSARRFQVENGYHSVIWHGLTRLEQIPVPDWRLSDQQICAALKSYERVMLADPHIGLQSSVFLAEIMKRAASGGPAQRAALVSFIDSALQSQQLGAPQFRIFVDEHLPGLGIAREEIPILTRWAAKGREIQLLRDRTIAGAGPLLGPALEHVLDGGIDLFRSRADQCEVLQKLFGADALARGKAFSHLLDLIVTSRGYDNLQAIARFNGYFSHELAPPARPAPPLDMLAVELSTGKMDLSDPDRDHARLIFLLNCKAHHYKDNSRLILKQLLKTVQAHPGGLTAQALKKLIERHHNYSAWAADVREVLRDGARNAGSDPERNASLPPIELPAFELGGFADLRTLEEHFGNLLEPRLYDQAHTTFLERLAKLADAIDAVREGRGQDQDSRLIGAARLKLSDLQSRDWPSSFAGNFVERGRMLHELHGAFRPLVWSEPDAVQKLASLAHQIEKRSAPTAKWMQDARAVRDMLPQEKREEMWLDHLRRMTEVGSPMPDISVCPARPICAP